MEEWEWYDDANTFRVFMHLLLNVNWKEGKWRGVTVPRGSLIASQLKISEALNLSRQQIRTSFSNLRSTTDITTVSTRGAMLVNLCNFSLYNDLGKAEQPQLQPQLQPQSNHRITTIEEEKKIRTKREREEEGSFELEEKPSISPFDEFWSAYPKKLNKAKARTAFEAAQKKATPALMLEAVKAQASSEDWKKDGGQFIPHPTTWLNGERWSDERTAAVAEKEYVF